MVIDLSQTITRIIVSFFLRTRCLLHFLEENAYTFRYICRFVRMSHAFARIKFKLLLTRVTTYLVLVGTEVWKTVWKQHSNTDHK